MALVFTGVAAHTPILIPTVGKDGLGIVEKTKEAMEQLEKELYISHPDTLMVISPHGNGLADAMTINMNSRYVSNFEEFGDLTTKVEWKPATMLIDRFREDLIGYDVPFALVSDKHLDYGASVPLFYLTQHLPDIKVAPVNVSSGLDIKSHYAFGQELKNEIMQSTERVAVIVSADLSHRAGEKSPEGMSPKGVAFDEKVMEIIRTDKMTEILDIDDAWAEEANACGLRPLAMMMGLLEGVKHDATILSYEKPLGTGYLVASIHIS